MNEQIRKLAEQSGAVTGTKLTNVTNALVLIGEEEIQAFAKLIVKECAKIVAENSLPDVYSEPCLALIAEEIKEHFGVE